MLLHYVFGMSDEKQPAPNWTQIVGYLIAATLLIPLGFWLKQYDGEIGYWILSLGGLLY